MVMEQGFVCVVEFTGVKQFGSVKRIISRNDSRVIVFYAEILPAMSINHFFSEFGEHVLETPLAAMVVEAIERGKQLILFISGQNPSRSLPGCVFISPRTLHDVLAPAVKHGWKSL